jgi:hypothetical protein
MKRFLAMFLVLCVMDFGARAARTAAAGGAQSGGETGALQADTALQLALRKKDAKQIAVFLDKQFTWTDQDGQTRTSARFLHDAVEGGADSSTQYSDVKAREYGQLAVVTGTGKHPGNATTFFARVWVKRPAGWLLLTHQDTPILAKDSPSPPAPAAGNSAAPTASDASGCENPCRTLPYKPKTAEQKEIVEAYQAVETAVSSHDAKTWADHVADEFVGIGRRYTGTPDTKAGRIGQIGIVSNPVILPKMLWGEAFVFGDAALLIADHQPLGETPDHVIRVWVKRDGRWQLFHRQETTIKKIAGPPKVV